MLKHLRLYFAKRQGNLTTHRDLAELALPPLQEPSFGQDVSNPETDATAPEIEIDKPNPGIQPLSGHALQRITAKKQLQLGHHYFEQGQWASAIAHYRQVIQAQPEDAEAYQYLAEALRLRGDLDESVTYYRKAIELAEQRSNVSDADALRHLLPSPPEADPLPQNSLNKLNGNHIQPYTNGNGSSNGVRIQANGNQADGNGNRSNGNRVKNGDSINDDRRNAHDLINEYVVEEWHAETQQQANGHVENGHASNGQKLSEVTNGHDKNGHIINEYVQSAHSKNGHSKNGHSKNEHYLASNISINGNGNGKNGNHADGQVAGSISVLDREAITEPTITLAHAEEQYRQEHWEAAIACCRYLLEHQPSVAVYKLLGNALQRVEQFAEALEVYQTAIELDNQCADVYANLGSLYAQQQRWQDAVAYYESAIALNPEFAGAYRNLAKVWTQLNQPEQATDCWQRALLLEPDKVSAEEHVNLGNVLLSQDQVDDAIVCYRHAIQLAPDFAIAYQNLAEAHARIQEWQEAVTCYRKANELGAIAPFPPNWLPEEEKGDRESAVLSASDELLSVFQQLGETNRFADAEDRLEDAEDYFEQEQWDEAIVASEEALKQLEPEMVQAYRNLANALYAKDDLAGSVRYYRRVVELEPNAAGDWVNLGSLYAQQQQWQSAMACYQKALTLNPNLASAHWNLGKVWEQIGQPERSADALFRALRLEPSWATAQEQLALCHTLNLQGKTESAAACYQQVLQLDATCAEAHFALAGLLSRQEKWQEAIAHYRQAVAREPQNADYQAGLGQALAAMKQWQEAIATYRQVIVFDPNPRHYLVLAKWLELEGKESAAATCYHQVIQLDASCAAAYCELGRLFVRWQRWQEAIAHYRQAVQYDPQMVQAYVGLGQVLAQAEQWEGAIAAYRQAVTLNPDPQLYLTLIQWLQPLGKPEEMIECYQKLAELQPENAQIHHKLGDLLNQQEQWQQAVTAFERAIALNPEFSWSHNNLGDALLHLERWQEAADAYRRAIALNPEFHWSHYNLAEALAKLEEWDGAIEGYRKALELDENLPYVQQKIGDALHHRAKADLNSALGYYQRAIQLNPGDTDIYHKTLEIRPKDAALYLELANALVQSNELDEAIVVYQMGLQLQPNNADLLLNLQKALRQIQTPPGAQHIQQFLPPVTNTPSTTEIDQFDRANDSSFEIDPDWNSYHELGDELQLQGRLNEALEAYQQAIERNPLHSWSFHNLGDTYLKLEEWSSAIAAYDKAIALNPNYFWSNYNLGTAYANKSMWRESVSWYQQSIDLNPGLNLPLHAIKDVLLKQWNELFAKGDALLRQGNRQTANTFYRQAVYSYRDSIKLPTVRIPREVPHQPKILLVVDDYLPQCFRYRVQQKIEQLEYAGFPVECFSSREIVKARNMLHFCHVAIFYRVPALPDVIETIEYAKTIKKVVFYEIDDLIFDETDFPDPIESYGGQITVEQYEGLMRGTTLFREAMALCDYAIASTPTLAAEMEKIVGQRTCFLHRNALDALNLASLNLGISKIQRSYLSIFYGSGTKAHNADFSELVAPAIVRLFEKYPNIRLTIMGYVTLPAILEHYVDRIDRVQLVRDVELYWEFLKQADINIAVLNSTKVNDCKSELKWFEAASFKIPSVVSATRTYLEVVQHRVDGLIARSTEDWFENLEALIVNPDLRAAIGQSAYDRVWQEYSVPVMANNIKNILLAGIQSAERAGVLAARTPKKKLLIVNVFYPPQSIGGATRIVRDNVEILQARYGHEYDISVFTSDHDNPTPYQISEYSYHGVLVTKVSTPAVVGMDWHYEDSKLYEVFSRYLEFNHPELIHFHCVQRLTASVLQAAADQKIPYLVTVHDAWWISDHQFLVNEKGEMCHEQQNDPLVVAHSTNDLNASLRRRQYLKHQLNQAQAILAVSEAFAELYRRNGFPKTQSNRNGIMPQPRLPRKPSPSGRVRLAHIGGMAAHKGYYLLQEAIEAASLANCEVIVIDHAQIVGSVRQGQWGSTPVTFMPKVPQQKMAEFYSTIDVLVAPSLWPESFGLVTREAAAAGVWVIASDKGALAEDLIPNVNGNVFSPERIGDLVAILKKIDDNPRFYQQALPGDVYIRTTEDQVKELEVLYQSTIAIK
ncbi:MAG: hypothetical protein Kow00121_11330 [Elainellaceae cyanobacterium]